MAIKSYRDLKVWERAMDLVVGSYRLASLLPTDEHYGIVSQIRRAAVLFQPTSRKGDSRDHFDDYLHHLSVGNGSLMELETHLLIAQRLA